ncbi:hypothetical protein [Streptomyces sp. NPDC059165]
MHFPPAAFAAFLGSL